MSVQAILLAIVLAVVGLVFLDWLFTRRRLESIRYDETQEEREARELAEILEEVDRLEPKP